MNDVAIVHNRVDALTVAYRLTLSDETRAALRRAGDLANAHGRAAVHVARLSWELKNGSAPSIFALRRDQHFRMRIDLNAAGGALVPSTNGAGHATVEHEAGWTIEVIAYAAHLAEVGLRVALDEIECIVGELGRVHERRLRRLDLAADVAGWALMDRDRRAFVRRSRVRTSIYSPAKDGYALRAPLSEASVRASATAHETRVVTGFTIGRGDVVARIYDKREELQLDCSQHKAPAEEARWRSGGWDGQSKVTRVEFQLRGEALKELGCRTLDAVHDPATGEVTTLPNYLGRIWATCLNWVRLAKREKTRTGRMKPLTRCSNDPRWEVLAHATWGRAAPIKRKRERGGASTAQALGSVLSVAAARGKLETDLPQSPNAWNGASVEKLKSVLTTVCAWSVDLMATDLLERWGTAEDACIHVAVLWNAARARFARMHEREGKIPWLNNKSNPAFTRREAFADPIRSDTPTPDRLKLPST